MKHPTSIKLLEVKEVKEGEVKLLRSGPTSCFFSKTFGIVVFCFSVSKSLLTVYFHKNGKFFEMTFEVVDILDPGIEKKVLDELASVKTV